MAHSVFACVGLVLSLATVILAQPAATNYKGLELAVTGLERATNVSLTDCPPGANIVRGVIKPGDANVIAATKLLKPGETDTITFDAPPPGTYPYVSTFPGFYTRMKGVLTVK